MTTPGVNLGGVPEFSNIGHQQGATGTADARKGEMKASVSGGGTSELTGVLDRLAKNSDSDSQLKGDVKDFLLQRGGSGTYVVEGKDSTFVFKKFNDGSVFGQALAGTVEDAESSLSSAHNRVETNFAQKQREVGTPSRVQARIDRAVEEVSQETTPKVVLQGSATANMASSANIAGKPSRSFWAMLWSKITTAANETASFFDGVGTQVAGYLSEALSQVDTSDGVTKTGQVEKKTGVNFDLCKRKIDERGLDSKNWSPQSVYDDDELLGEMVKWAEDARPSLGVERGSLDPIHFLGDVKKLDKMDSESLTEFSDSYDDIYKKYFEPSDGSVTFASNLDEVEDSYTLNVGSEVTAVAKGLFEVPKGGRDDNWRRDVMVFLKGQAMDNNQGINRESTFDSFQEMGNLSPVKMFTDAMSRNR